MNGHNRTLRTQLMRWLLVPLSIIFLLDAAGSYVFANRLSSRVYDRELMDIARELALHVKHAGRGYSWDLESDAERTLLLDAYDRIRFVVRTTDGQAIAGQADLFAQFKTVKGSEGYFDAQMGGNEVRVALLRTPTAGAGPDARVEVAVAETLVKRNALEQEVFLDVTLPQLLLILIAVGIVWAGVIRGLAPMRHLQQAVAVRSHRDLSAIEVDDVPGEAYPLVAAVNDLMARLNEVIASQSRFIADAAHQLRTPVAGLKAHIELAMREEDPAEVRRALAHIYTAVQRMSQLVAQLLSLARNEASTAIKIDLVPLDLNKLAFEVSMDWVPEAYRKNVDLGFEDADKAVMISGNALRLTELINNLLDNAVRYSRAGGRVTVRVAQEPSPRVLISDDGPTIPVEERQRIFERFHRLLGNQIDGTGLGLAIAHEIAVLHGAEITLDDDVDGVGNTFTVSFPAVQTG